MLKVEINPRAKIKDKKKSYYDFSNFNKADLIIQRFKNHSMSYYLYYIKDSSKKSYIENDIYLNKKYNDVSILTQLLRII